MKKRKKYNKIVSFLLVAVMIISVVTIATPQQAKAAGEKKFKGKGTSTVTISDDECYDLIPFGNQIYYKRINHYIKFKSDVTGYITIKFTHNSNSCKNHPIVSNVIFCTSKTDSSSGKTENFNIPDSNSKSYYRDYNYTRTYGVKKGKTYYFKVSSDGGVKIKATVTAVKKGTNNSRAKAKTLKKNTTAKGVLLSGENKADWYKIKVTKKQKVKLIYNVKTNSVGSMMLYYNYGGIKFTFCKSNGKPFSSDNYAHASLCNPSGTSFASGKQIDIRPGIYYIKVEPYKKNFSGYYTIKWK